MLSVFPVSQISSTISVRLLIVEVNGSCRRWESRTAGISPPRGMPKISVTVLGCCFILVAICLQAESNCSHVIVVMIVNLLPNFEQSSQSLFFAFTELLLVVDILPKLTTDVKCCCFVGHFILSPYETKG